MHASQWKDASRQRLASDVSSLLRDLEEYLTASTGVAGEAAAAGGERVLASIQAAKLRLAALERDAAVRTRAAGQVTANFVHQHVWQCIATAACVGVVAGWLSARR